MEEIWLARDKDNSLWLFVGRRPQKVETNWYNRTPYYVALDSRSLPEVQWLDDEPTKVKIVIEKLNGIQERQTNKEPDTA